MFIHLDKMASRYVNSISKMHKCDRRQTNRPRYGEMSTDRQNRLRCRNRFHLKYVAPLQPSTYSSTTLTLALALTFQLLNWKLAHWLFLPRETFTVFFGFTANFSFGVRSLYGTDGRTNSQTDRQTHSQTDRQTDRRTSKMRIVAY